MNNFDIPPSGEPEVIPDSQMSEKEMVLPDAPVDQVKSIIGPKFRKVNLNTIHNDREHANNVKNRRRMHNKMASKARRVNRQRGK